VAELYPRASTKHLLMKKSKLTRRKFLQALTICGGGIHALGKTPRQVTQSPWSSLLYNVSAASEASGDPIDRKALVRRHNPLLRKIDPLSPLSVGNGEFAFTGDVTGLQTFPREYDEAMPLCTMSQWG